MLRPDVSWLTLIMVWVAVSIEETYENIVIVFLIFLTLFTILQQFEIMEHRRQIIALEVQNAKQWNEIVVNRGGG